MLTMNQFKVLEYLAGNRAANQRELAEETGLSLGTVNTALKGLRQEGLAADCAITPEGLAALKPHKVENAIILAAGMATRFVPVSYEIPKGLIRVKGEPLIERLIRQLQEAGIPEIVVVVGYMMEKFLYLRDKYGVEFVVNNEFAEKNTHSSIYAAREYMKNTLILCADNYYPKNMFKPYEYRAYYCGIYLPGTGYTERSLVTDSKGLVIDTHKPSHDEWILYGHAYWDRQFSERFRPILEDYYGRPGVENMYWETIWSENLKACPLYMKKCSAEEILEFDSVSELEAYDKDYILSNSTSIMHNICGILQCEAADVRDFRPLQTGLNNRSFTFVCKGQRYVYRHPGINAEGVIDRKTEAFCQQRARELGIDTTLIYVDPQRGWKISKYVDAVREFDFSDKELMQKLADHLRRLHEAKIMTEKNFSYMQEADRLIEMIRVADYDSYVNIMEKRTVMEKVIRELEQDGWPVCLCHNDIYEPNLLVDGDTVHLIDWEFAGNSDIGYDICKLFSVLNPPEDQWDDYLELYYGRKTTGAEKTHLAGCAAVQYYYWFVWGIYASKNGTSVSDYMMTWYDKMVRFCKVYQKLREEL